MRYNSLFYICHKILNINILIFLAQRLFNLPKKITFIVMEWLSTGISPLKDLISFLHKKSKTNDVLKKHIIIELRDNLNLFQNAFVNNFSYDNLVELLSNKAYQEAIKNNFSFKKLRSSVIETKDVFDERNKRYIGWTAEKLADKIDEKIVELKNIKKLNSGSFKNIKNDIPQMMSNLYFRMKLMADFIKSGS